MSSLSVINTPIQAAAGTGASLGGIHQSLQAKEFQNVGAYAARWFYSKKEEPDPVVEHQKRVKHIKSSQTKAANASLRQTFTALLKSATENWNPETKLQVLLAVRECAQGEIKHIKKAWIENTMAQVLDAAQFKEVMEILKPTLKRAVQASPSLVPVVSPPVSILPPGVAPPSGQAKWQSTAQCYSGTEGVWISTDGTNQTVQLYSLTQNVFTRVSSSAIQAQMPPPMGSNLFTMACENRVYDIMTVNTTLAYIKGIVNEALTTSYTVSAGFPSFSNRGWQIVKSGTNFAYAIWNPAVSNWYLHFQNLSISYNVFPALPNTTATPEPTIMSFQDTTVQALWARPSPPGLFAYPFDSSNNLGTVTQLNGGVQEAYTRKASNTPLTVGKPVSLIGYTLSNQTVLDTYDPTLEEIVASRVLGAVNSTAEDPSIANCDPEINVYARPIFDQTTNTWGIGFDFVNATNNSSSILNGGEYALSNTSATNHPNALIGCSSNYTAALTYFNQTQDAVVQTITLVNGVPTPLNAPSPLVVPSPLAVPSSSSSFSVAPSSNFVPSSASPSAAPTPLPNEQITITIKPIDLNLGTTPIFANSSVTFSNNTNSFEIVSNGDYEFEYISNGTVVPTDMEFPVGAINLMNMTHVTISGTQIPVLQGCSVQNVCNTSHAAPPLPEPAVLTNTAGIPLVVIVTPIAVILVLAGVGGAIWYFVVYRKKKEIDNQRIADSKKDNPSVWKKRPIGPKPVYMLRENSSSRQYTEQYDAKARRDSDIVPRQKEIPIIAQEDV